jgi:hypothetical protein
MGVWGPAVFSDDTASDVRESFREWIGDGLSAAEATERVLHEYASSRDDPNDGPPLWLGLAVTQWKCGRLQSEVQAKAIEIIDSGIDIRRWSGNAKQMKARQAILDKTRELLLSPQPPPKRISKTFRQSNDWEVGELISYRTAAGKYVVFRVLGHHIDKGGKAPEMDLLNYYSDAPPALEDARALSPRPMVEKHSFGYGLTRRFMVGATSERQIPKDRLKRLGMLSAEPEISKSLGSRCLLWKSGLLVSVDTFIEQVMPGDLIWRPGPGGQDHLSWELGDVLAHKTESGNYLLFQLAGRYRGDGIDDAPVLALLDWRLNSLPNPEQISSEALPLFRRESRISIAYVLVNDGTDAAPTSALTRIGQFPPTDERRVKTFGSLPMVVRRVEKQFGR